MIEGKAEEIQVLNMDHHGMVAAFYKDLGIVQKIDKKLPPDPQRKFEEIRQRMGYETQRAHSAASLERTPALMDALFSVISIYAMGGDLKAKVNKGRVHGILKMAPLLALI
jgi:hypothetical protein